jgi:thioredoxin-related protein
VYLSWVTEARSLARNRPLLEVRAVRKLVVITAFLASLLAIGAAWAQGDWETNYKKAQEEAKAQGKLLFLEFTGSDWCGPCILMDREVLSKPEFKDYAKKNLVLVEVDFPRRKMQPDEVRKQNMELAERYQVEVFPTLIVLNGEGKLVWKFYGLYEDGPTAFVSELEKVRKG